MGSYSEKALEPAFCVASMPMKDKATPYVSLPPSEATHLLSPGDGCPTVRNSTDKFATTTTIKFQSPEHPNTLVPICHQPAHKTKNTSNWWQSTKAVFNNYFYLLFWFTRCFCGIYHNPDTFPHNLLHSEQHFILKFEEDFYMHYLIWSSS